MSLYQDLASCRILRPVWGCGRRKCSLGSYHDTTRRNMD